MLMAPSSLWALASQTPKTRACPRGSQQQGRGGGGTRLRHPQAGVAPREKQHTASKAGEGGPSRATSLHTAQHGHGWARQRREAASDTPGEGVQKPRPGRWEVRVRSRRHSSRNGSPGLQAHRWGSRLGGGREGMTQSRPSLENPQAPGPGSSPGWGLGNISGKEDGGGTGGGSRPRLVTLAPEGP